MEQLTLNLVTTYTPKEQARVDQMKTWLGSYWFSKIGDFMLSQKVKTEILDKVAKEREEYTIFPREEYMFRAFRRTGKPKVVILGQD